MAADVEEGLLLAGEAASGRSSAVALERTATSVASWPYCLAHFIVALHDALPDGLGELAVLDQRAHGQPGAADVLHVVHIQLGHDVPDLLVQHVVGDEGLVAGHGDHEAARAPAHPACPRFWIISPRLAFLPPTVGMSLSSNFVEPLQVNSKVRLLNAHHQVMSVTGTE
jgi:hypothetical protein